MRTVRYKLSILLVLALFVNMLLPGMSAFAAESNKVSSQLDKLDYKPSNEDFPKGTLQEREQAKAFVYSTKKFQKTKKEIEKNKGKILENKAEIYIFDNKQGVISFPIKDSENGLLTASYIFDLNIEELGLEQKYYFEQIGEKLGKFKWVANDKTLVDVKVNEKGNFITDDGKEMAPKDYYQEKASEISSEVSTLSACTWAVGLLCAAAATGTCITLCAVGAAVANVIGVEACGWACGILIGGGGCIFVTDAICS